MGIENIAAHIMNVNKNLVKRIVWFLKLLIWILMTERQKISTKLQVRPRRPFKHPCQLPTPSVDYKTRCALEHFKDYYLDGYMPGLSDSNRTLAQTALNGLIRERTYSAQYPMAYLHGFTNGKSLMCSNRIRASQPTMAAMGQLVNDLPDLEGKSGNEIIEACLAWGELNLGRGIRLLTDSWHRRYYWSNNGGSHHMSVLCYELQRQNRQWTPQVEIHEHTLNLDSLNCLINKISIFVVMRDKELYIDQQVFEDLPLSLRYEDVKTGLGVSVPYPSYHQLPFKIYQLILVDHSQKYADIALAKLNELLETGHAMRLREFLEAWISPDNDRNGIHSENVCQF